MTGFGRALGRVQDWSVTVEVKTVNHKGLDVKLRLPRAFSADEAALMQVVRSRLERGRVDVTIDLAIADQRGDVVDHARVDALVEGARALAKRFPEIAPALSAGDVLRFPGVLVEPVPPASSSLSSTVMTLLQEALEAVVTARQFEGEGLLADLAARRARCGALVEHIAHKTGNSVADKKEKLTERLRVLLGDALEPGRLVAEVALLAERIDTTEELTRLRMHLSHLDALLSSTSSGRKIDFLCQELMREANTTASKCQDAGIAHDVVELKSEIERLREQAQNVE
jgi:uncharacterized protein (TIGR00255 family)